MKFENTACSDKVEIETIFKDIVEAFDLKGEISGIVRMKRGHINDTYCVNMNENGCEKSYLVQRVNHNVFKNPNDIMKNVEAVTGHIRRKLEALGEDDIKRKVLKVYRRGDGSFLHGGADEGGYWRVLSYVYNARTYDEFDTKKLVSIGCGFGRFQAMLCDFPGGDLFEIIPNFHNTPKRYDAFFDAVEKDVCGRADEIRDEIRFFEETRALASRFAELYNKGKIPLRVTHNDTKGNNIMIDIETEEPLAVIDLDTVMPGFAMNDFGDAVRYAANTAAEDERDLSKVSLDLERYEALAQGFMPQMSGKISEIEIENMPWGALLMTLELAARFMTDYIEGDKYFKIHRPAHNLERARCQIALAKDMQAKFELMERITGKYAH